jgi:hypothetical protein
LIGSVKQVREDIKSGNLDNILRTGGSFYFNALFWSSVGRMIKAEIADVKSPKLIRFNLLESEAKFSGELQWFSDPYMGVRTASEYLKSMGVSRTKRVQYLQSFDVRTITVGEAGENMYGIRFHDFGKKAKPMGQTLFESFSNYVNRGNLAIPFKWNEMTGIKQWKIKLGTTFIKGKVAPQFKYGPQYIGGNDQIFILEPWKYGTLVE